MATIKKLEAMHKRYGKLDGKRCGDCINLIERNYGHRYFKCAVYGMSHATSSDWAKKWTACGHFNIEYKPDNHRALTVPVEDNKPLEGQITMEELMKG